ncbi:MULTISPECIES: DUF3347 domain-containing protein [Psychroflexus]|uniref:DUF3347 domain-containing protein n=1 Tax=Psychroflexus halocasei TaxID=908615 RepID=A0A1H4AFE4_9FLAO|nr:MULTISPECIES: DUF3347 domain-containing protein [Psychroflexus]PJX22806.1 hypothetical protein CAP47_07205 [Psychroflexus sp. S27]SEA34252.1 Protein of unknown function [Psychroflexus halocasei]
MNKLRSTLGVVAIAFITLTIMSCKENKNEHNNADGHHSKMSSGEDHSKMNHQDGMIHDKMNMSSTIMDSETQNSASQKVLADYMTLKDALVETDKNKAAQASNKLNKTLNEFDLSEYNSEEQKELKQIIAEAKEHAEYIGKNEMKKQREHFETLSKNIMDMVAITGTENTLYQQFCPMYADNGGVWVSTDKNIRNPYFGSKMMKCGEVQKEIN